MTEAYYCLPSSAGGCLNDQATLLDYNTLKGVYQIGVQTLNSVSYGLKKDL